MKKTIIMFLLAAALGAYVWIYEIEGEEQRKAEQELEEKLIAFEKDSIHTIIVQDFETIYRFEKIDNKWRITHPVNTDADESTLNGYLSALTSAKKSRTFNTKPDEKNIYGLLNPAISVKVYDISGNADSVQFGDKTGIGEDMYICKSLSDTLIGITPISLKNDSQKPLLTWRDKKAIQFDKNTIHSFSLKSGKDNYSFEKSGSNWNLTKPLKAKADNNSVNAILNKLDFGRIKTVASENPSGLSAFRLSNPQYVIELFGAGNVKQGSIAFSSLKDNESFGKDDARPHIFTVDSNFVSVFNKSLFDVRDKDFIDLNVSAINRVNLLFGNSIMTFTRDTTDTWSVSGGQPIKSTKVDDLVSAVQNLQVDGFVAENPDYLRPYGLTTPQGSLELFANSSKEAELEFGNEKNDKRYLRNAQSGQVVLVNSEKLKNIIISLDDIKDDAAAMDNE
jgi:hypothetical protein